jgi:Tachylectin
VITQSLIYAVADDGDLFFYRDEARDGTARWSFGGTGQKIGNGWGNFQHVFSGGDGRDLRREFCWRFYSITKTKHAMAPLDGLSVAQEKRSEPGGPLSRRCFLVATASSTQLQLMVSSTITKMKPATVPQGGHSTASANRLAQVGYFNPCQEVSLDMACLSVSHNFPAIAEIPLLAEDVFYNLLFVSVRKTYPMQAYKIILGF